MATRQHSPRERRLLQIETWGQTENSGFIAAPGGFGIAGGIEYRKGSVGMPYPGINIKILNDNGEEVKPHERGNVVILPPVPPAFMYTIWRDPDRYVATYWSKFEGKYLTGDYGYMDEDNYVYILGRVDDVLKIAGHRLGPADVENIVMQHPAIAEVAVVATPDPTKGETLAILVTPKIGMSMYKEKLVEEVKSLVRRELGPVAVIGQVHIVDKLPRTRTGKIMRRVIRAMIQDQELGDLSTLEDMTGIEEIKKTLKSLRKGR